MENKDVAMSVGDNLSLGVIEITTKEGSVYRYPDMDKGALRKVLPSGENRLRESTPSLALCNASFVVLTMPFRIIQTIRVDGEEWFQSPA